MSIPNPLRAVRFYRDILGNIAWLGGTGLVVKPVWFLFIAMACVRYLDAEDYGILTTALSLASVASSFTSLGISQYIVREVARDRSTASRFFSSFLPLQILLVFAAGLAAIATGTILGYSPGMLWAVAFASAYTAGLSLTAFGRSFFRAFEVLKHEALSTVAEKSLVITGGLILLVGTATPHWTLLGMAGGMALTTVGTLGWIHSRLAALRVSAVSSRFLADTVRRNIPFALLSLFGIIYFRVDTIMVEAFLGPASAGHYGLAYRIIEALNALPLIVAHSAIYPRISALHAQNKHDAARRIVNLGLASLAAISAAITALLVVTASPIVGFLANDAAMAPAASALQYLSLTFPLACMTSLLYIALVSLNKQRTVATFLGLTTLLNVILNLIAIPRMGVAGACVTTVVSELVLLIMYGVAYLHNLKRSTPTPVDR